MERPQENKIQPCSSSEEEVSLQCISVPPESLPENGYGEGKAAEQRKPGGSKTIPYILGNETLERLAGMGLLGNFMVFLMMKFHLEQVPASNIISIWSGVTNFGPLIGAFVSDAYLGRFKTIAFATFPHLMGMVTMTLIAWIPHLHPPSCKVHTDQCVGPTTSQFAVLAMGLGFLSIGSAGIRPCSIPFGVDQFDSSTEEGRRSINSFFNWYDTSFTVVLIIALTLIVYIQNHVSWALGFGIPMVLMIGSIALYFAGTKVYVHVKPEGSVFTSIAQVVIAAHKKRKVELPEGENVDGVYYDPPLKGTVVKKLPFTNILRFFNKAAIITEGEIRPYGSSSNPWRLCSIQKVEETKCLFKIIPIWAAGIICFTAMAQQGTFTQSQAQKMNRHLGPKFQIPTGSMPVIYFMTIGLWLPLYDKFIVPHIIKITRIEGGITQLQRMGIGIIFSILSMIVAGLVERMRRASALTHGGLDGVAPLTVFWLAPQLILMGFAEAFNINGQIQFYNKEFPKNMSSLANSLTSCTMAGASFISLLVVNIVHHTTGGHDHPDWLTKNINEGRVENLYFILAGLGVLNFGYFIWVARGYQYKSVFRVDGDDDGDEKFGYDVELNDTIIIRYFRKRFSDEDKGIKEGRRRDWTLE